MSHLRLNLEKIKAIIPHRDPMLLVDEVVDMMPEDSITSRFYVDPDRDLFRGHFPEGAGTSRRLYRRDHGADF